MKRPRTYFGQDDPGPKPPGELTESRSVGKLHTMSIDEIDPKEITATRAARKFSQVVTDVIRDGQPVVVTRNGRALVVLSPLDSEGRFVLPVGSTGDD